MATKADERKALAKIREIVEGLGADSYIGIAFEGCFEIARDNIDNDWACSMRQRAESAEETVQCREAELADKEKELKELRTADEKLAGNHHRLLEDFERMRIARIEAENKASFTESKVAALENEVVQLKAKLYDLLCK